ncbi:uncharacterized protein BO97DRAFT_47016 [Aspergillus homomorphus CBS 101889]|uniref:RING-type domain-containing protein n=1 Tax=Aspergillus homomorphus (strain CBS 101889) TaxID=1450537 RepID=A0A395HYH9_ASPHC|nr:hypothetical protein BO97DRAFT_47016 [Aspergillus homomorphus CBS 101889]RAL12850.1 hypothetical protein BO97DRAFT_47016 [Aspergillus homomorphus CBS 101889]
MTQRKPSAVQYEIDLHQLPILDSLPLSLQDQQECIICLEDLESVNVKSYRQLPCQHFFHQPCIDDWLKRPNPSCPLCRRTFEHLRRPCKATTRPVSDVVVNNWSTVQPLPRYLLVVSPGSGPALPAQPAPQFSVPVLVDEPREAARQSVRAWCKRKLKVGRVA